jgi:parvulin-like peptidyl-prolyl isomerase
MLSFALFHTYAVQSQTVVEDEGVQISREEFAAALAETPSKIQALAATDLGDRLQFINDLLLVRKLAAKADGISPDTPGYWDLQFQILGAKRQFAYNLEVAQVEFPDPEKLAQEYYATQKDKYASKPETRASSHILLASRPGLPREGVRAEAQALLDQLREGTDFEAMVSEHSDDPGSKARDGSFNRWIKFGEKAVTPPYSEALFEIDSLGGYSEITDSEFGIHIIRLDGIREGGYYSYEEVRNAIYSDIAGEFRSLAAKSINAKYNITDDAFIDGDAVEELFAPYK